jgi:hypothetical protein
MLPKRSRTALLGALLLSATGPVTLGAQARVIDEGTFSLFVGGTRIGREDFSIRTAAGASDGAYVAQANVLRGESKVSVRLNTDSAGFPLRFTLDETEAGRTLETISGEARRDLWSGRANRPAGERAREFPLPRGSLAAEPLVIHHLWFLLKFGEGRMPAVLHPRSLTIDTVDVEDAGPDRVSLGLREFVARKWLIRPAGSTVAREAWTDLEGRLLRVRVPDQDLEAVRDEPPAETPAPLHA